MVFEDYANFYDWLYRDKDYQQECAFVKSVFETYGKNEIKSILDLGCGTGSHALLFADMGYAVTGVDFSEKMLQFARRKAAEQNKQIDFRQGDIRHLDLPQRFDAAVAMFTVLGYQATNQDVEQAIRSVHKHLNPGGLFIFDVWFGPAVLTQKPADRVKIIEHADKKIVRYAHPVLNVIKHTVEVNYTVFEIAGNKVLTETKESHLVRFFFYPELNYFLENNGFGILRICPFMDMESPLDDSCWNISVITTKTSKN